jgi:glycosyltransferase involved in cell wall biosynthesis
VGNYEEHLDPVTPETKALIDTTPEIEAVGPQYGDDLKAYYAASDCFVFPSYREGFPNTVMEAGAMDLPSIVTDINGSREIIINGENGVIIPSKDAAALHSAMLRMVTDTAATQRMASAARQLIASRFEQGFVRQCLYDFYDEIVM